MAQTVIFEGFETGEWTHDCRVFPTSGTEHLAPYNVQIGNIFTPKDWRFWFQSEPGVLDQPEAHNVWNINGGDPRRVRSGRGAYLCFTFFRNHRGGIYRRIPTKPGQKVKVTAYAHAWSNSQDGPHVDDPYWSEWAGEQIKRIAYDDVPPLNGEMQNDAAGNVRFRVLLDPAGTEDIWASTMVWDADDGQCIYNGYQEPPITNECTAKGDFVTVWLVSRTRWPFKHNDAYWDDISIVIEDTILSASSSASSSPSPSPSEEPEPDGRLYDAFRVLMPQQLSRDEWIKVYDIYANRKPTFCQSADDAGGGNEHTTKVEIMCVAPERWTGGKNALTAFFTDYYPKALLFWDETTLNPNPPSDILLWQKDARWANEHHGGPACTTTIGTDGCFDTCLAMAQRWFKVKTDATPLTVQKTIEPDGYAVCKTTWAAVNAKLGMTITGATEQQARDAISAGSVGLADVIFGDDMHFVMVVDWLERSSGKIDYYIYDPWLYREGWMSELRPGGAEQWRILVKQDQPPVPPKFNPRVLALHLQSDVEAAKRYVTACQPSGIKVVQNAQDIPTYAMLRPGMRCYYRSMSESDDPIAFVDMNLPTLTQVADMFEARGLPLIDGHYFWWELWNEKGWNPDRNSCIKQRDMEIAAIKYLAQTEPRVGAGAFCAGVGNGEPANFDIIADLARVVTDNGGTLNIHSYFGAIPTRCTMDNYETEGRWLQYRFEMIDDYLTAHGIKVNWFLSEGGAIYYEPPTNMPYSTPGWRHKTCMVSDWPRYLSYLEKLAQHFYDWNMVHDGRLKGYSLFTQGGGASWQYFELGSAELDALAAMQIQLWPIA